MARNAMQSLEFDDLAAPEGAVYCIGRYRDANRSNLRTQFLRILRPG
jgi:hypothetical protein